MVLDTASPCSAPPLAVPCETMPLTLSGSMTMADFRPQGLTYDDVLLVPKRSDVASRRHVSTATRLSRHITLGIPIVSANMDSVTVAFLDVAIASQCGIVFFYRVMVIV